MNKLISYIIINFTNDDRLSFGLINYKKLLHILLYI